MTDTGRPRIPPWSLIEFAAAFTVCTSPVALAASGPVSGMIIRSLNGSPVGWDDAVDPAADPTGAGVVGLTAAFLLLLHPTATMATAENTAVALKPRCMFFPPRLVPSYTILYQIG